MTICKPIENFDQCSASEYGGAGVGLTLRIVARDANGEIIAQEEKDNDLFLKNWALLLCTLLREAMNYAYPDVYKAFRITGDTYDLGTLVHSSDGSNPNYHTHGGWGDRARIRLGASTKTPEINDFDVMTYITEVQSTNAPQMSNDGNVIKLVMTATVPVQNETTFAEVSICIYPIWSRTSTPDPNYRLCLTRDTFTPVTVPAGGSLTVQFEMWFNGAPS